MKETESAVPAQPKKKLTVETKDIMFTEEKSQNLESLQLNFLILDMI